MSRTQASSLVSSTTRISEGSTARACSHCRAEARTVIGSLVAMATATAANASWAGFPPSRQVSVRSGQTR